MTWKTPKSRQSLKKELIKEELNEIAEEDDYDGFDPLDDLEFDYLYDRVYATLSDIQEYWSDELPEIQCLKPDHIFSCDIGPLFANLVNLSAKVKSYHFYDDKPIIVNVAGAMCGKGKSGYGMDGIYYIDSPMGQVSFHGAWDETETINFDHEYEKGWSGIPLQHKAAILLANTIIQKGLCDVSKQKVSEI
jgi:hypothetical protein